MRLTCYGEVVSTTPRAQHTGSRCVLVRGREGSDQCQLGRPFVVRQAGVVGSKGRLDLGAKLQVTTTCKNDCT